MASEPIGFVSQLDVAMISFPEPQVLTPSSGAAFVTEPRGRPVLVDELDPTAETRCATMRPSRKATSLDL